MKIIFQFLLLSILMFSCKEEDDVVLNNIQVAEIESRSICENGTASGYPCNNYDVMARISIATLNTTGLNDIWGWTDPSNQKEYALVATQTNTAFIDITDAESPKIVGYLPSNTGSSSWRDVKVYANHAFIVSEATGHGMQVFDLTNLRNIQDDPIIFEANSVYTSFNESHNIVINEDSGYAYAVGTDTFDGGPHIINIQNPQEITFESGYSDTGYTHDAQAITYNGPDQDYVGRQLLIASSGDFLNIIDVTNTSNPSLISRIAQNDVGYIHQGWIDDEHTFYYANDELDETEFGFNSRTLVFNLSDLDNPTYLGPYFGPTQAIDHNLYTKGDELFLSNYTNGIRVVDISNPDPSFMREIGFFDTYPQNDDTIFDGAWSVYPYFNSGNIIISDISNGFFIVRKTGT